MKVYATREICGYARGEEIEVYVFFKDDSTWWGLIWSKSLCSWVECQIKYFSMEPIEKDDEGEDPAPPSTTEETKIGRLIDADALAKEVENAYKFAKGEVRQAYSFILDLIADAPTIPAPRPEDIKNGGEITIEKKMGEKDVRVSTAMHPFIAIWAISSALEEMLYRAGETEDDLQLDLSGGNARKILRSITDMIANDMEKYMEEKDHGKAD